MSYSDKDKAKEHWNKSKDEAGEAGQHARSAAGEAAEAGKYVAGQAKEGGKYVAGRLTAPVGGEGGNDAKRNVDQASEKAEREGKSAYNKIKDSIGGFFGQAKETGHEAANYADDVAQRAADKANQGIDKTRETRRDFHKSADSPGEVQKKGEDALDSAKDAAVQTKDAVVGGLSYIGGRLTAPVSGDEGKDKEVADKAKANVNKGADKLSSAGQETRDKAAEKKEQTKGFFSGVFGGNKGDDEAEEKGKNLKDKASHTLSSAEDKVKDTYDSAKDKVKDTYDSTRAKMQEAADSVEPHNEMEAIKSSGGIPSNTADLLKAQERREVAELQEHETIQGMHTGTTDYLSKTASAWGDGTESTLGSLRAAADGAGPHSTWK